MTYIDRLAREIAAEVGDDEPDDVDLPLYRIYAVLCLAKGEETTRKNVHDAWAAWRAATLPDHPSLVPFGQLHPRVQALDAPYAQAIEAVARRHRQAGDMP